MYILLGSIRKQPTDLLTLPKENIDFSKKCALVLLL